MILAINLAINLSKTKTVSQKMYPKLGNDTTENDWKYTEFSGSQCI